MSSERDRQVARARELDRLSTALFRGGAAVVRRNPIKTSLYLMGIAICFLFSGLSVSESQRDDYYREMEKLDYRRIEELRADAQIAYDRYYRHKGWFSCDERCQMYRAEYQTTKSLFESSIREEDNKLAHAKSKLGVFSEYGVEETRNVFWQRFAQGKGFAKRQTGWDMIFYGIGAMARDESMLEYLLRVVLSMLFNFTIGIFGAVVAFIFSLYTIIQSYQASFFSGTIFFILASLASVSFAISWIVGLYAVAATGTFVTLKLVASNLRIENEGRHQRVHY
jgi:hypothetical protein